MTPADVVDQILATFRERGGRHYGENVTELEHALQSAALAREAGEPRALVVACLLHDYGHLVHDLGERIAEDGVDAHHEVLGAKALSAYFGPEVVEPARLHVDAKRYLCAKDRAYLDGLSTASRLSLQLQGGPMTDDEALAFERNPFHQQAIRLRHYDDLAKVPNLPTPSLDAFRDDLKALVRVGLD